MTPVAGANDKQFTSNTGQVQATSTIIQDMAETIVWIVIRHQAYLLSSARLPFHSAIVPAMTPPHCLVSLILSSTVRSALCLYSSCRFQAAVTTALSNDLYS